MNMTIREGTAEQATTRSMALAASSGEVGAYLNASAATSQNTRAGYGYGGNTKGEEKFKALGEGWYHPLVPSEMAKAFTREDKHGTPSQHIAGGNVRIINPNPVTATSSGCELNQQEWIALLHDYIATVLKTTNEIGFIRWSNSERSVAADLSLALIFEKEEFIPIRSQLTAAEWRSVCTSSKGSHHTASTVIPPTNYRSRPIMPMAFKSDSSCVLFTSKAHRSLYTVARETPWLESTQVASKVGGTLHELTAYAECMLCHRGAGPESFQARRMPHLYISGVTADAAEQAIQSLDERISEKVRGMAPSGGSAQVKIT